MTCDNDTDHTSEILCVVYHEKNPCRPLGSQLRALGRSGSFGPIRDLKMQWSRAFNL